MIHNPTNGFVVIDGGDRLYGIPVAQLRDIHPLLPAVTLPSGQPPESFRGIANWHGLRIPLFDLRLKLNRLGQGSGLEVLVVEVHNRVVGVMVKAVPTIVQRARHVELRYLDTVSQDFITETVEFDVSKTSHRLLVIDIERLITDADLAAVPTD